MLWPINGIFSKRLKKSWLKDRNKPSYIRGAVGTFEVRDLMHEAPRNHRLAVTRRLLLWHPSEKYPSPIAHARSPPPALHLSLDLLAQSRQQIQPGQRLDAVPARLLRFRVLIRSEIRILSEIGAFAQTRRILPGQPGGIESRAKKERPQAVQTDALFSCICFYRRR